MNALATRRLNLVPMDLDALNARIRQTGDEAYCEMLAGAQSDPEHALWYTAWGFYLKETGELVGDACFKGPGDAPEIGYGIDEGYRGRGYATEGVRAMIEWAFERGVKAVEAEMLPDNAISAHILKKLGFQPTGTLGEEGPRYRLDGGKRA